MPSLNLGADHRQSQTLSPRLQHAVRLLQMSSLDFADTVRDMLGKNPFLEGDEGDSDGASPMSQMSQMAATSPMSPLPQTAHDASSEPATVAERAEAAVALDSADPESDADGSAAGDTSERDDDGSSDRALWQADTGSGGHGQADDGFSALDTMAVETPLNTHLHGQLNVLHLSRRDLALACMLVESLDDDGYLRTPLEELQGVAALDPVVTLPELQQALQRVQSLEPAGVAARSVAECMTLQLHGISCAETRALASTIIEHHMKALAGRDVAGMARQLGQSPARVEAVCDRIRRLDPRPGWRLGGSQVAYVVPDVIVRKLRGQWTVQLNPAVVPKVRLNQVYAHLFQRHRSAAHAEMGAHLHEARWTLRNVEQRFSTILDVAEAIVARQKSFLEYGSMAMKPLGLKEIAEAVGIHESTVSRVTNNKYMSTPSGVFELKYFFSRAMVTGNGGACSGTAIRGLIKDIIEAESADKPLSDAEITRQLWAQGLVVARRTVTKYRQVLKIEPVDRRRRHA